VWCNPPRGARGDLERARKKQRKTGPYLYQSDIGRTFMVWKNIDDCRVYGFERIEIYCINHAASIE
jgi:hypothetical protein